MSLLLLFAGAPQGVAAPPVADTGWPVEVPDYVPRWLLEQDDEEALVLVLASAI